MKSLLYISLLLALLTHNTKLLASDKNIDTSSLDSDEGYLLLKVSFNNEYVFSNQDSGILRLSLTGEDDHHFKNIKYGNNIYIAKLPEGNYYFESMTVWGNRVFEIDDIPYKAEVVAGKIAYAGDLIIHNKGDGRATFVYKNRAMSNYKYLEKEYSDFLSNYPLVYTGLGSDYLFTYLETEEKGELHD